MDTDLLKVIGPILGGLLALVGGVFTFVNGRLRDAETPEQKDALLRTTAEWIEVAPSLAGLVALVAGAPFYAAVVLFTLSYLLQARLFLRKRTPVQRIEIATFSALTSVTAASIVFAVAGGLIERLIDNQERMLNVQLQTIRTLETQTNGK